MPDVQDLALAIRNLEIDYKQSCGFAFEGNHFLATPMNILWIERQITFKDSNKNRAYDINGFPCHVHDLRGLVKKMREVLNEEDEKFVNARRELTHQLVGAFTDVPPVPEDEE